jgi:hypothetical protein
MAGAFEYLENLLIILQQAIIYFYTEKLSPQPQVREALGLSK